MNAQTKSWIDSLLAGTIDEEDFDKLQELLKTDAGVFRYYCRQAEIDGRLEWELGNQPAAGEPIAADQRSSIRGSKNWWLSAAAAAVVFAVAIPLLLNRDEVNTDVADAGTESLAPASPQGACVARLTIAHDAEWAGTDFSEGAWLLPGSQSLTAGSAEVTFDSGARVILQAPAEFEIVSAYSARLTRGAGVAHIPDQAAGFRLETPTTEIDDQGSAASVAVAADGRTDVKVLSGMVEIAPKDERDIGRVLTTNESVRVTGVGFVDLEADRDPIRLVRAELPVSMLTTPSEYLHWSFDERRADGLMETGVHAWDPFVAKVVPPKSRPAGFGLVDGRFGKAVRLDGRGTYLSTEFPGIAGSAPRTVSFWVLVPPNVNKEQGYSMVTWGAAPRMGGKWQIAWNSASDVTKPDQSQGTRGAIRTEFGGGYVIGKTDLRDGRWHHVASVFLGGSSPDVATHIRHYIDGRLEPVSAYASQTIDTRLTADASLPTHIGRRMEEWGAGMSFKGAIDELYVFPSALTPEQIGQLYRSNSPPSLFIATLLQ